MKVLVNCFLLFFFTHFTSHLFGQSEDTSKMNSLMVYGDGFMFGVKEPDGWVSDTKNAEKYYANIIFFKSKGDLENGGPLIQVYNFGKKNEKTEKDLAYDVKGYKEKYKNLREQDFSVSHKDYKCYSKLVYVGNNFYQYIIYVNPGAKYKSGFSVAMNIKGRPATADEIKALEEIVSSLIMFKG